MFEINNRLTALYRSIAYLRSEWVDGSSSRASAVVVGINDVLTALHTVYSADRGGWATRITVIPAADTSPVSHPLGEYSDVGFISGRAQDWDINGDGLLSQAESEGDLALLGMRARIGDATGILPVVRAENDFSAQVAGYPGKGTGLMAEEVFADASSWYSVYNVNSGLGAGASGGPLLHTGSNGVISVAGVLSSGNSSNTSSTYAALFSDASWNWLQGAMAANDYLIGPSFPTSVATATGTIFTGGAGADSLVGGSGWDTFFGHAGNDVLDGGGGIDSATFTGLRSSYTVVAAGGAIIVTDSLPSRDGVDSLRNIERVKFADLALAFDFSGSAGQAHRLYQAALGRSPDKSGLGYQINVLDSGVGLVQVAGHFIASPEFTGRYGGLSDLSFVNQLYTNILGRLGDRPGVDYHQARLAAGTSRADVLVGFSQSPENQVLLMGQIQNGIEYDPI